MQEIEVAVRSAAQHQPAMLDIKHRVPFEEAVGPVGRVGPTDPFFVANQAARRISGGSVLSVDPINATDQKSFDEYIKYFKTKPLGLTG